MTLEKTLEVFKKRTPEEKQQYIYKLVRENNQLRNELAACFYSLSLYGEKEMKLRIEDIEYDSVEEKIKANGSSRLDK